MCRAQFPSIYSLVGCNSRQYDDVMTDAKIADDNLGLESDKPACLSFSCSLELLLISIKQIYRDIRDGNRLSSWSGQEGGPA